MGSFTEKELDELRLFAEDLAGEAAKIALSKRTGEFRTELKADSSFVTEADLRIEEMIRERVAARLPGHQVIGEEGSKSAEGDRPLWIIDPIDGTENFVFGLPTFGTIIAMHQGEDQLVGLIAHPALGHIYSAARGTGCFFNGGRIAIADSTHPRREILCVGSRPCFERRSEGEIFDRLLKTDWSVRQFYDCFSHTRSVHGQSGATLSWNVRRWDICATKVLVEEAGGVFSALRVEPGDDGGAYCSLFGKRNVVEAVLKTLQRCGWPNQ